MYQISTRLNYGHPDYEKALDCCTTYNNAATTLKMNQDLTAMSEFAMTVPEFIEYKLFVEAAYVLG